MKNNSSINRRTFLKTSGTTAAAMAAAPAIVGAAEPLADPVRLAHIGSGVRGWDLVKYTGAHKGAKVVPYATCTNPICSAARGLQ